MIRSQIQSRTFVTSTRTLSWFGDLFGRKKAKLESQKKREEIIEKQDEFTADGPVKVTHLTFKNSDKNVKFDREKEMPGFVLKNWKTRALRPQDLEAYFANKKKLQNRINGTLALVLGKRVTRKQYKEVSLSDLELRFKVVKALQSSLGVDLNDYTITKCHDLDSLYNEIENVVSVRWKNEKHPDAIVLRPGDFTAANVYLNEERSDYEKQKEYSRLLQKMKHAQKKEQSV
ncbi:hypothetical protein Cantr_10628 [Candida viswanathii]|uniref:Large ribosomal subunit protein mL50 n=1 Tax=Candida viswanathii TaxID=5486 RepID=A0A367YDY6_9ASCO|nr:hypothetical protein Cantr_10628 [Candida viswanathii]